MPRKEATPEAPGIEASEEHVNVEVTPKVKRQNRDDLYKSRRRTSFNKCYKNGETWTLDKQVY